MKKIAYIYNINNKYSYAAKTVANGFKNAFIDRQDSFRFFDLEKLQYSFWPGEKLKLINYAPDIIFASVENLPYIPLKLLKSTSLVLWGAFYSACDYEPQIHTLSEDIKQRLNKYSDKHNILIWSQHDESINEQFFSGYKRELGLKFTQLLHCADKTMFTKPVVNPEFDFIWVGNIGHRVSTYKSFIIPFKEAFNNFLEYSEHNMINPATIERKQYYARSFITPNIHTEAQIKYNILLNERVFTSSMMGGFQICDNILARELFTEDELIIATKSEDFLEKAHYYISHPDERMKMITKMQENISNNHTYFNRIDKILENLG